MPRIRSSIEEQLALAQVAITNALANPGLQAALAVFGYTAERLRQGLVLRDSVLALYQRQKGAYGDLFAASDALDAAQRQAQDSYMGHVKVARVALKDDRGALQTLNLAARRKRALAGWLAQAQQFYANALASPGILGRLATFGLTRAVLEAGQREVAAVSAGNALRMQRKGAAQDATKARDAGRAALDAWMGDFLKIARVALQGRPQLLAQLGVSAPARRAAARPAARAPTAGTLSLSVEDEAAPASAIASPAPDDRSLMAERRNGRAAIGQS